MSARNSLFRKGVEVAMSESGLDRSEAEEAVRMELEAAEAEERMGGDGGRDGPNGRRVGPGTVLFVIMCTCA